MDAAHKDLIQAATDAIIKRYRPEWHVVGAALRLRTGEIVTGVHIDATVGRIAVCAEAVALGRAVTEHGSTDIETIVAVYHPGDGAPFVCPPWGMCREMIFDYAPDAVVLVPTEGDEARAVPVSGLLPAKYRPSPSTPG
jgi:cytidine deaminase